MATDTKVEHLAGQPIGSPDQPPRFTVIMPTWGRGRHILPSIRSVLQQGMRDFELLVIGDACTDDTEAAVQSIDDPRLRWLNLPRRAGVQSGPNNAGIAAARGRYIAYLGHDDIWEPTHLEALAEVFAQDNAPDFGISGIILHWPNGLPGGHVTGIFKDDGVKHTHFFPPSCFAHRREVIDRIGPWRMPGELRTPVDEDLLRRAAAADLRFASTGRITVHKFTATHRYLSYVRQESDEQTAMLAAMSAPGHAERVTGQVARAKRDGTFMRVMQSDPTKQKTGQIAQMNARRRGLSVPPVQPLGRGAVLRQRRQDCALDWWTRPILGIRLQGRNPWPRLLLPFSAVGPVRLVLRVVHPEREALGPLQLACNGVPGTARPGRIRPGLWGWTTLYTARIDLAAEAHTIVEFRLDAAQQVKREYGRFHLGFGIGQIRLSPLGD
ncbi:MAG: hypothetical protein B7Z31_09940 [Rhodobacterales bacterium 12-65-15]|nr:MAG: hypothetical protein B7Z31_09940 [Rhodobacterales bacterium 12-65-15]